jgi:hypothetical protein
MKLYRAKQSFRFKSLKTGHEEAVHEGQLFLVQDFSDLPAPNSLAAFMFWEEYEMLARKA